MTENSKESDEVFDEVKWSRIQRRNLANRQLVGDESAIQELVDRHYKLGESLQRMPPMEANLHLKEYSDSSVTVSQGPDPTWARNYRDNLKLSKQEVHQDALKRYAYWQRRAEIIWAKDPDLFIKETADRIEADIKLEIENATDDEELAILEWAFRKSRTIRERIKK